jgi:hypothetical protein
LRPSIVSATMSAIGGTPVSNNLRLVFAIGLLVASASAVQTADRPNVVIILADDMD